MCEDEFVHSFWQHVGNKANAELPSDFTGNHLNSRKISTVVSYVQWWLQIWVRMEGRREDFLFHNLNFHVNFPFHSHLRGTKTKGNEDTQPN